MDEQKQAILIDFNGDIIDFVNLFDIYMIVTTLQDRNNILVETTQGKRFYCDKIKVR